MSLPKIESPVFSTILPTGEEIKFRPFNVKEQKNLLIIAEGGAEKDILMGIVAIVNECTFSKIDWMKQPTVNLEHAFLHIRSKSVGEVVEMTFICKAPKDDGSKCNHKNFIEVDVRTSKSEPFPEVKIKVTDSIYMIMENLTVKDVHDMMNDMPNEKLVKSKTKMVVHGEEVITEFTDADFKEFVDSFPPEAAQRLNEFFEKQPTLILRPATKCKKCGEESFIELKGVLNFFG
jgi:hypothetical protein